jgi:hypothetical protein
MADENPKVCGETGPGLVPDPSITCGLPAGHEGRHRWEGEDAYGNLSNTEWGSSGPSDPVCGWSTLLPIGGNDPDGNPYPLPKFACMLAGGHGGAHHWAGVVQDNPTGLAIVQRLVEVDWNESQMVVQAGPEQEAGTPPYREAESGPDNADVNFDPEEEARHAFEREQQLNAREEELAKREAALKEAQAAAVAKIPAKQAATQKATAPAKAAPAKAPAAKKAGSSGRR